MSSLSSLVEEHIANGSLDAIREVASEASARGLRTFLVGGVIRDLLLGRPVGDIDLVVEGDAVAIARALSEDLGWQVTRHLRFGTASLKRGDVALDLATARTETYSRPGALPDVKPGTIEDDLRRRDFTVNAMAVEVTPGRYGARLDPFHGQDDLRRKLVRILHPRSFIDDPTRIFRATRYEQRLDFRLEAGTERLLRRDLSGIGGLSGDRVRHEMEKMLREDLPEKAVGRAGELGILAQVDPSLYGNGWLSRRFAEARQHGWAALNLYLALLTYQLSDPEPLIVKLNFSRETATVIRHTAALKGDSGRLAGKRLSRSAVYDMLRDYSQTALRACVLASDNGAMKARMALYLDVLRYVKPRLTGDDLVKLGVRQGEQVGKLLQELRRARLDGEIETREQEMELVRRWVSDG